MAKNFWGKKSGSIGGWPLVIALFIVLGAGAAISCGINSRLSPSKSDYQRTVTGISNSLDHMHDLETGLSNLASAQGNKMNDLSDSAQDLGEQIDGLGSKTDDIQSKVSSLQVKADDLNKQTSDLNNKLNGQISDVNQKIDVETSARQALNSTVNQINSSVTTLTSTVNGITGGIQIIPTILWNSGTSGTIDLAINSSYTQNIVFKVEFRATTDVAETSTMDTSLAALYGAPPVSLTAGSSIRGDYTLFWNTSDSKYHLGFVTFITGTTALATGTQTKDMTFNISSGSYEILITPVFTTADLTSVW